MSEPPSTSRNAQRHLDLIHYREETLALYHNNPAVADWFGQFRGNESERERFLERYADERASALVYGETFWNMAQKEQAELVEEATERLWEIQQRKLFELQCRWRAEEVTLPTDQIELSDDFERWGEHIEACPLVSPITAAEVEGYLTYLLSDACTDAEGDFGRPHDWQDYECYRRYLLLQADGQDPDQIRRNAGQQPGEGLGGLAAMLDDFFLNYPDWYAYCDAQAGPPNLVRYLPDHRGGKEAYYCYIGQTGKLPDAYDDDGEEEDKPAPPAANKASSLRTLDYDQFGALSDKLIREFESAELLRFHEAVVHEPTLDPVRPPGFEEEDDEEEDADETQEGLSEQGAEAGRALLEIPERLPIAAHADWREALHHTWLSWRKQRLARALREAYAAYAARQQAGTPHPSPYPDKTISEAVEQNRAQLRQLILKGRALAGEPQDFNF